MKRLAGVPVLLCLLVPFLGCDKATPVAPSGTTLTISANPTKVSLTGSSTITIIGRKPDGNPLNPGTEVRLSSDRGTVTPSVVGVDSTGRATATFRADGRLGDAKVTAATADATVDAIIQVGEGDNTKPTVLVSVTPSTIALNGTARVTVIARNADGSPVAAGERVTMTTTLGSLRDITAIKADGTATATLNAGDREGTATITAIVGSSAAATTTATIVVDLATAISVTANPSSVPAAAATTDITVTATVTNSRAQAVEGALVTFETELGKFADNTAVTTNKSGQASKILTVVKSDIPALTESFKVKAKTPVGSGNLEGTTTITISR